MMGSGSQVLSWQIIFMQRALPYLFPLAFLTLLAGLMMPTTVHAQAAPLAPLADTGTDGTKGKQLIQGSLDKAAKGSFEGSEKDISKIIGNIINTILGLVGILFLVMIIYSGILYMTAQGDEGKVKKAKGMLTNSIIGIVIVMGAYIIVAFVIGSLDDAL